MERIGTYNGISCYRCTHNEYVDMVYDTFMEDKIFIIGETMVLKNKIMGYYDGYRVKEVNNKEIYYIPTKKEKLKSPDSSTKVTHESKKANPSGGAYLGDKDLDAIFASVYEFNVKSYTGIVDKFMAEWEKNK